MTNKFYKTEVQIVKNEFIPPEPMTARTVCNNQCDACIRKVEDLKKYNNPTAMNMTIDYVLNVLWNMRARNG